MNTIKKIIVILTIFTIPCFSYAAISQTGQGYYNDSSTIATTSFDLEGTNPAIVVCSVNESGSDDITVPDWNGVDFTEVGTSVYVGIGAIHVHRFILLNADTGTHTLTSHRGSGNDFWNVYSTYDGVGSVTNENTATGTASPMSIDADISIDQSWVALCFMGNAVPSASTNTVYRTNNTSTQNIFDSGAAFDTPSVSMALTQSGTNAWGMGTITMAPTGGATPTPTPTITPTPTPTPFGSSTPYTYVQDAGNVSFLLSVIIVLLAIMLMAFFISPFRIKN